METSLSDSERQTDSPPAHLSFPPASQAACSSVLTSSLCSFDSLCVCEIWTECDSIPKYRNEMCVSTWESPPLHSMVRSTRRLAFFFHSFFSASYLSFPFSFLSARCVPCLCRPIRLLCFRNAGRIGRWRMGVNRELDSRATQHARMRHPPAFIPSLSPTHRLNCPPTHVWRSSPCCCCSIVVCVSRSHMTLLP